MSLSPSPSLHPAPQRELHPALQCREIWPGASAYPWAHLGSGLWTREALLRQVGPDRLLATWTTGGCGEPWLGNFTMIQLSDDNGQTWEDAGAIQHPTRGLFTTELFQTREGHLHAFFNTYGKGVWMTQLLNYRTITRDGGRSWETPHSIPGGVQNVWPNKGIQLASGRWVIPVSWAELSGAEWAEPSVGRPPVPASVGLAVSEPETLPFGSASGTHFQKACEWADRNHRYVCGVMLSDDEGQTFRLRGYLRGGLHGHLIEPQVVELSSGKIVMLIRSQRDGRLWEAHSLDGGETWSEPVRTDIPNPAAKIKILKSKDGRIFLLHNPVDHEGAVMGGRNLLALWVSDDDMQTWKVKVDLIRGAAGDTLNYPDGFIDEASGAIIFCWEDSVRVYLSRVPLSVA